MDKHVVIIGAGPSGSVAAALLRKQNIKVTILEKATFPRFVIGESLLPYSMTILEDAGLLDVIKSQSSFQFKNGAAFNWGDKFSHFDFSDKFTQGPGTTYQVPRAIFDQQLAYAVQDKGAEILFNHTVIDWQENEDTVTLQVLNDKNEKLSIDCDFVLDASGYGRVLPKLLHLDVPNDTPPKRATFTHIEDHIDDASFDRNKILIVTHPEHRDVWYWVIPFGDGRLSIGVVGEYHKLEHDIGNEEFLKNKVNEVPYLHKILKNAVWDNDVPVRQIENYTKSVSKTYGKHFALLGNAGGFLDPVFSSGVTIAFKSAQLATQVLTKQFNGQPADWENDFAGKMAAGIKTFKDFVNAWYCNDLQDIIYSDAEKSHPEIRRKICAILAGYAWDESNPYTKNTSKRLAALAETCRNL